MCRISHVARLGYPQRGTLPYTPEPEQALMPTRLHERGKPYSPSIRAPLKGVRVPAKGFVVDTMQEFLLI